MKRKTVLTLGVIAILIVVVASIIALNPDLFKFELTGTQQLIIEVRNADTGTPVSGATVTIKTTSSTFHYLGDVAKPTDTDPYYVPEWDGIVDEADSKAIEDNLFKSGSTYDLTGDNQVTGEDYQIVLDAQGQSINSPPCYQTGTTGSDGIVSFYVAPTVKGYDYYTITVTKTGYYSYSEDVNVRSNGWYVIVSLQAKSPPVAVIKVNGEDVSAKKVSVGTTLNFDGSDSYDPDGQIVSYAWYIGGSMISSSATTSYTFNNYGTFKVTLKVTDNEGNTDTDDVTITVTTKPVAKIYAYPTSGESPLTVNFDGSGSYDPDSSSMPDKGIVFWNWNFGDGSTGSGKTVTHTFSTTTEGTKQFVVTLTVTDDDGESASAVVTISVSFETAIASFTVSQDYPYINTEPVTFDASASKPSSGGIITEYHWTIKQGDTIIDEFTTSSSVTQYTFTSAGTYTIELYVVDSNGVESSTVTRTITAIEQPSAEFTVTGDLSAGEVLTFQAITTGEIMMIQWDFGDGSTAEGSVVTHQYAASGVYTVTLTVKDIRENIKTAVRDLNIAGVKPSRIEVLTSLRFPPSETVSVQVRVYDKYNNPIPNKDVFMTIYPVQEIDYGGAKVGAMTDSNGIATFQFVSPPSSLYTYTVEFTSGDVKLTAELTVIKSIAVQLVDFPVEQEYNPGSYDLHYSAKVLDKESGEAILGYAVEVNVLIVEDSLQVDKSYLSYDMSSSTFTLEARIYDFLSDRIPSFNWEKKTVKLQLTFSYADYKEAHVELTTTMIPPNVVAVIKESDLTVGADSITIGFYRKTGEAYPVTESQVEVIITTPSGKSYSTRNELADDYVLIGNVMTIVFPFEETGRYKVKVMYNLEYPQDPDTFTLDVKEQPLVPPILNSPTFWGGLVIFLAIVYLLVRKKKGE